MTSSLLPILPVVDDVLFNFAQSDGFWANLVIAFGTSYDVVKATELQQQWQSRNFSQLPSIEVLSGEVLGTAKGAYSSSTNKIYLSASFLNTASSAAIVNVILEEIGHYVDAQINQVDSAGDDGAIFAELVQGNSLDVATLDALRAENDQTTIIVNGEIIQVEQANLTGTNGNDTITGTSGDDTISPLRGQDNVNGGDGNDLLIVDYSSNTYAGTTTFSAGIGSYIYWSGSAWNGSFSAYTNSSGNSDSVNFSNIERFQITGTNADDYFDRGGYGVFNVDGGTGTDTIGTLDFSSFTTNLTIDNSGGTFTESNGNVVKNVERFNNLTTGTGNDSITFTGSFNETIATGEGDDTINGGRGQDNVNGGDGNDLLIVNYSSNTYAGTTTYPAGMNSSIYWSGSAWNGNFSANTNSSGNYDYLSFSNIERFQITGTNADDYFDRGGYGVFNIDGGTGTDTIGTLDFSSFTTNLTIDNSGGTFTESNGNVVRNVERFNNLTTGTGNDSITFTGSFNETIATGEGDDTINGGRGQDNVNGGDGNDLLIVNYSSNTYAGTTTYPAGMNSSIYWSGSAWNGNFSANTNSSGNYDYLSFSNIERFQITGTNADDYFDRGGYGVFNIDGGTGTDTIGTLDFSSFTTNLTIDNSGGTFTESNGNVVKNVERFNNLTTGTGNDSITFTGSFNETIATGEGDDTINGGRGQDNVNGGDGNDLLIVNYSSNTYAGTTTYPAGMNSSIYWSGSAWNGNFSANTNSSGNYDYLSFSNIERFQITGTNADDYFDRGGYGVFNIDGGTGTDTIGTLDFSSFTTNLTIDNSGGTFTESNGNVVRNVERFNNLTTGTGNDSITFTGSFNETIATGEGDDTINGGRGQDNVNGGDGNDLLIVNYSSNTYAGTTTYPAGMNSSIYWSGSAWNGNFSANTNSSGNYDYLSFSNIERFQITGTNADDYFDRGGYGVFNIDGGTGTDTIGTLDFSSFTTNLTIDNSGGTFTESNGNVVRNVERFNNLTTGTGNDSITFTGSFNETIATGEGDDTINGGRGQDNVNGGNNINGGDENDLLIVNYSSNTYAGTTTYKAGISSYIYWSGSAWNGSFSAYINSSGNYDYLSFSNIERFQITGTNANDTITTGGGNDIITGVNPNSSTPGKGEIDSLTGGAGSDRFILGDVNWIGYDDGNTTNAGINDYANIIDFDADDVIQLRGSSSDYLLTVSGTTTNLYINKPGSEPDELIAILRDRIGLSLTASYFSYVSSPTLPSITLAVSPASVTEDGTTNLVYTFTRSGVTTDALTVNYTVGGTATNGTDYTSIPTSVTFAAGSATATVTVDPTADTTVESDETVILTLASGTGYTVGTTTAVTGTITNVTHPPSITLAVSPSSVNEDGTTNLVYTFTRSGVTTDALTANYTVEGTATNGTDYTSIPTSVTFAAGSATATVTVDPTADTTVEPDETVILTLASGTGYTVGTTTAVTGTITNVTPPPSITLAVSPSSVNEDGTTNLVYTFTRNGVTSNALTVNYTVGGTATFSTDYTQTGAASYTVTTGTVNFVAGSETATVTVDPTADTTVESDETVILTLASGTGYTLGTTTAVTGTITNDDSNVTPIEAFGNTKLVQDTTNKLYTQIGNNNPTAIKIWDTQITTNSYSGWQTLAAETVNGVNQVLWKYNDSNHLHLWSLDSNWNWQSSTGWWGLNSSEAFTQETNFQQDFNGDGIIGSPYTTIEAFGNTKLVQDTTNKLYTQIGNNNPTAIKIWDTQITTNSYSGWQTLAAETVNGVNQVLWKYNDSNHLHLWSLDSNWNWQSSTGWWGLNSSEAFTQETNFQQDFNGDGIIGSPYTTIEAFGNTKLVQDTTNKLYTQIGNNNPTAIKIWDTQITTNSYSGWQTLAAETVNGVNQVLWKYNDSNHLHLWSLDSNWNWQSSTGWWGLNSSEAFTQETNFQQDFNGDGIIGSPYTTIEAFGNTKLVQDTTNKLYTQIGNNNPTAIKIWDTQITTNSYSGWQTLAAETVNGVNQVLWKYNDSNHLHLWSLDSNWNWQSSTGWWGLNSSEAFTQETNFQQDFNGDGIIGSPYTTIEAFGNTKLVQDTTNNLYAQIDNNNPIAIKIWDTQITTNSYSGWQTLAAETVNGVNQVLWKYNDSNHLHLWSLDSNWNWQSSTGWWGLNSSEAFTQETNFQQDFNGDNQIGNPLPNIASSLAVSANVPEPIIGSSNDDILTGTLDNDILVGGLGNDTITGGAGGDNFTFNNLNEGIDTITDFLSSQGDKITLSAAGFGGGLAAETAITAEQFVLGTTALNASNRLIYNTITGDLFFDGDGTGTIAAIQIATLSSKPTLTASDILVLV